MFTPPVLDRLIAWVDACPWAAATGCRHRPAMPPRRARRARPAPPRPLYTPEERARRDASPWTVVQGILAPLQFAVFLVSLALVVRFLVTGEGLLLATVSVIAKTVVLYTIMITGAIWEREVFGRYLFARPFFWEDVFSLLVIALHTAYLAMLVLGLGDARGQMMVALAAYAAYVVNAAQFLLKLRAGRREGTRWTGASAGAAADAAP
ncbi:2-vinyl bacteriochlorophyllide hydratase [Elioraea sp. Yellowstone]|jgi:3-vinyl bacteriochlorophyllide hydratase|uniref:2-vinyl bacteriochlorophyllide hydratase n=1 Tax=Elioraea sp. Yellowstone TaxID=2592070 RepID=UPI00114EAE56|nr:2-vinyl bacteriochlorophyllide hydratase [Elioraea sp. Yellowstone]TQF76940.1 2-vinyl bacteriochlorophyllide hydratase [Elioraea sp. Yellowstone]